MTVSEPTSEVVASLRDVPRWHPLHSRPWMSPGSLPTRLNPTTDADADADADADVRTDADVKADHHDADALAEAWTPPTYHTICAPMVRYSKLAFRHLVRDYGVSIAYTPMILADVFKHSAFSRTEEFQSNGDDDPVVIQFAAKRARDLADAALLAAPYCNAVDLNCGCPQRWAIKEEIGSYLMEDPERVRDMIRQTKQQTGDVVMDDGTRGLPVSVKIRVHSDLRKTVAFVQQMEAAGADWITVHGRTRDQKSHEPVSLEAIRLAKQSVAVPLFANGDVWSRADADRIVKATGVDGVMAARGLLENPALYAGYTATPVAAVARYLRYGIDYATPFFIFHHHLMYMTEHIMSRAEKRAFNCLTSIPAILEHLDTYYGIRPAPVCA